eukprot:CAMPEP_0203934834 /NCGR_PEP_ID=MMETSP0359-20131031/72692_1 /ASSEMBLY_ACC=CAM_ASM_000338 /TAXON_ID=268821 /ORGANISM="Scrippsiella Hangoei, Strain SHTV-5" /LENGTH=527 /DNA_ID=CAMNT_0050864591 /DNA_START=46 /DNA_END=1629 /DNA_ORIENTATION=-
MSPSIFVQGCGTTSRKMPVLVEQIRELQERVQGLRSELSTTCAAEIRPADFSASVKLAQDHVKRAGEAAVEAPGSCRYDRRSTREKWQGDVLRRLDRQHAFRVRTSQEQLRQIPVMGGVMLMVMDLIRLESELFAQRERCMAASPSNRGDVATFEQHLMTAGMIVTDMREWVRTGIRPSSLQSPSSVLNGRASENDFGRMPRDLEASPPGFGEFWPVQVATPLGRRAVPAQARCVGDVVDAGGARARAASADSPLSKVKGSAALVEPKWSAVPAVVDVRLLVYGPCLSEFERAPGQLEDFKERVLCGLRRALPPALCLVVKEMQQNPIQIRILAVFSHIIDADHLVAFLNARPAALTEPVSASLAGFRGDCAKGSGGGIRVATVGTHVVRDADECRACFERALYCLRRPCQVELWNGLGSLGGGSVGGWTYSAEECFKRCRALLSAAPKEQSMSVEAAVAMMPTLRRVKARCASAALMNVEALTPTNEDVACARQQQREKLDRAQGPGASLPVPPVATLPIQLRRKN